MDLAIDCKKVLAIWKYRTQASIIVIHDIKPGKHSTIIAEKSKKIKNSPTVNCLDFGA